MDNALRLLSETRHYFLRREALALGIDDRALARGRRVGVWVRIRQGAYCHTAVWNQLDAVERHVAWARATHDQTPGDVALSHVSALAAYGCPLWNTPLESVHLTRLDGGNTRSEAGVVHHGGLILPDDVVLHDGWATTTPARSTVDALSRMDTEPGVVAGDWMLRRYSLDPSVLWAIKEAQTRWPYTLKLEVVLRFLDARSGSVGESRLRFLFWLMGLPYPELQFPVFDDDGRLIGYTDFAWPAYGVYGEFDGRVKYGRLLRPGQEAGDVVFAEKRREDDIRRATSGVMVRWTWPDLHPESAPSRQVRALLRRAA